MGLMRGVDEADGAWYAPILTRVTSGPRQQCRYFDASSSEFDTDDEAAVRIGFVNERPAGPSWAAGVRCTSPARRGGPRWR